MRKLKKEIGKYKDKFLFKYFNCVKVGHFVVPKCPYAKNESSDDEDDHNVKKGRKHHQNNHKQYKHENTLRTLIRRKRVATQNRLVTFLKRAVKLISTEIGKKLSL